jgi:hypothetical protein
VRAPQAGAAANAGQPLKMARSGRAGRLAWQRTAAAIPAAPDSRKTIMARSRRPATTRGPAAVRTWERSFIEVQAADPVQPVLDAPVAADEGRELGAGGLGDGQRGNRVAGFAGPLALQFAAAHDLDGLGGVGTGQARGHRGDLQGAPGGRVVQLFWTIFPGRICGHPAETQRLGWLVLPCLPNRRRSLASWCHVRARRSHREATPAGRVSGRLVICVVPDNGVQRFVGQRPVDARSHVSSISTSFPRRMRRSTPRRWVRGRR